MATEPVTSSAATDRRPAITDSSPAASRSPSLPRSPLSASRTRETARRGEPPRVLFEGDFLNIGGFFYDYDARRDRFLLIEPPRDDPAREIRLVLHWFDELRRIVAAPHGTE